MSVTTPTLLFLHGFAESREVWTEFTRPFPLVFNSSQCLLKLYGKTLKRW